MADDFKKYPMPFLRIELAVLSVVAGRLAVLVGLRSSRPYPNQWALPGGVIRIDLDDDLEMAAQRIAEERLKTPLPFLRQLCAVGNARRDPRDWSVSVVYRALLPADAFAPRAGKRIERLEWRPVEEAIADKALGFDHAALIDQAVQAIRSDIEVMDIPFGFVPERFTLGELQRTCEQILGRPISKANFRRKLDDRGLVEAVPGEMRTGAAHRPSQIYRLTCREYPETLV